MSLSHSMLLLAGLSLAAQDPDLQNRILEVYKPDRAAAVQGAVPAHPTFGAPSLTLPRDVGAHMESPRERWSLLGILQAPSGQRIPFQVIFRRHRLGEGAEGGAWSRTHLLVAEASLCLNGGKRVLTSDRRGRLGLVAETAEDRVRLRCDGWSLEERAEGKLDLLVTFPEGRMRLSLTAPRGPASLPNLGPRDPLRRTLRAALDTQGQLELQGQIPLEVKGQASLLQEWGQDMGDDLPGWDQGLVQLRDGRTLVYLNLRPAAGHTSSHALLAEVDTQGRLSKVQREPIISQRKSWQSPVSGVRYPVALQFQAWNQILNLDPITENQEYRARWTAGSILWRGACRVRDGRNDETGDAFLELAGYAHAMKGRF